MCWKFKWIKNLISLKHIQLKKRCKHPSKLLWRLSCSPHVFLWYFMAVNSTFFPMYIFSSCPEKPNVIIITTVAIVIKCFSHLIAQNSTPACHLRLLQVLIWIIAMPSLAWMSHMLFGAPNTRNGDQPWLLKYMHSAIQDSHFKFLFSWG